MSDITKGQFPSRDKSKADNAIKEGASHFCCCSKAFVKVNCGQIGHLKTVSLSANILPQVADNEHPVLPQSIHSIIEIMESSPFSMEAFFSWPSSIIMCAVFAFSFLTYLQCKLQEDGLLK